MQLCLRCSNMQQRQRCSNIMVISSLTVRCSTPESAKAFETWLDSHRTSFSNLRQCGIVCEWQDTPNLSNLPCLRLRELHLEGLQLEAELGFPGVLHDCTCLTVLDLQSCALQDVPASAAAITALPELQSLT
jgi:hypothetical protein